MNSYRKPSKPFASMIRRFVSAKNSYRTTRNRRHLLGFESLESRRVLCDATPIVTEAAPIQLIEVYGAVQLAQIPQAPPQDAVVAPIGFAPISSVDRLPSTNDSIFASERAIQQILPSIAELGPYELAPANSDVNYFGEGEDPVPTDPSTNPPTPPNAPPSGPGGGGSQSNIPPTITIEYRRDEDAWPAGR